MPKIIFKANNNTPCVSQLRYLQTLQTISAEKNSTIIFPLPIDLVSHLMTRKWRKAPVKPSNVWCHFIWLCELFISYISFSELFISYISFSELFISYISFSELFISYISFSELFISFHFRISFDCVIRNYSILTVAFSIHKQCFIRFKVLKFICNKEMG